MTIPVNLVTGFLGVGKTTAVIDLLKHKPAGSRWAVLVNEYGDVSIDGALIEGDAPDGVSVREVGGGCVCCASAPYLQVALHFLLLDAKPERLVIETTGLGHPARLLDTLRRSYADRLEVRATLGLVDPADFARPEMRANPIFVDQVQLADVVVMNKLDAATPELVSDFQAWAEGLFPPKLLIAGTTRGHLDPAWLDLTASDERLPLYPEAHAHSTHTPESPGTIVPGLSAVACRGWVFPPDVVFALDKLRPVLADTPGVSRLKGVFRTEHEWYAFNRTRDATDARPTAYRRDSRVEVFAEGADWDAFEAALTACVTPR